MAFKQVKLSNKTNDQLTALSEQRKGAEDVISSKQAIVAYLINRLFKMECKDYE